MFEKLDGWRVSARENESNYSLGVALKPAPEAACQAMNKNAGCLQWRRKKGFLGL
jgi:hypothetical protein